MGSINYEGLIKNFNLLESLNRKGIVKSAISLKEGGLIEGLSLMTIGNGIGFEGGSQFSL
nr:hypothetical protein [endosymbiont 'TC1' of Trimyema compressum]